MDENEEDRKLPETDEEWRAWDEAVSEELEALATKHFGPRELREKKNKRYAERLIRSHTEPVVRAILVALSRLDHPTAAELLRDHDLMNAPLWEIVAPFELGGHVLKIISVNGVSYTVEISAGFGCAGDGARLVLEQFGKHFLVMETLYYWLN